MHIIKFQLGQLQANCYVLVLDGECLIIDPADEASFLIEELERRRLKPKAMLATHGHFDHIMAAGELQASYKIPFYIFEDDKFLVSRLEETAEHFLDYRLAIIKPNKIDSLKEGNMSIGQFDFKVIKTPGHTPGSASFYFEKSQILFTGDTLFKGAIGRFDFSYCDKKQLKKSLETIFSLPDEVKIMPGHEAETTITDEKKNSGVFFEYLK